MAKSLQHQILARAREIIFDKKHWTQSAYARDRYGHTTSAIAASATRFCAIGAISRAYFDLTAKSPDDEWDDFPVSARCLGRLEDASEDKGHAALLKAFDKLLEKI